MDYPSNKRFVKALRAAQEPLNEDIYDRQLCEKILAEHRENPVTYSLDEVEQMLEEATEEA